MRSYAGTCKRICSYNLVYNFLIQLLLLQTSIFVVHLSNAFWYRNKAFPKGISQNEIVPLLLIFHIVNKGVQKLRKYVFTRVVIKIKIFTCVALALFVQNSCCTRVVRVPLMPRVSHSCCSSATPVLQYLVFWFITS